ncbi:hypothetical protein EYC87_05340 [Halieaceae bacterium IMCC8485]|uniref:SURF1-like protein n=1 Tax=Candidatus Seongchinamella marina TaxID=2518990 RepID=A0ABT3SSQ4_9GAMM|nr:hypothetical protein [Candidatus Seongchinamella marina]MCX2973008.1 hypothetical protein [Candidatus Seongchinamella marina]
MKKARVLVFSGIAITAILLGLATTYAYGNWFSHPRYWNGTIMRVQESQSALIESILRNSMGDASFNANSIDWRAMFGPMDGHLLIEVHNLGQLKYSNANDRFKRGIKLNSVQLYEGWTLDVFRYKPPSWNRSYIRWLKQPRRWLEPSFDPITMPFFWFSSIYSLALLAMGFIVKSRYLEQDVLGALERTESKFHQ